MSVIVCYVTCWSCKFGHHNLEPHPWWGPDDVEYNEYAGLEPPEGDCTCNCAGAIELEKEQEAYGSEDWLQAV